VAVTSEYGNVLVYTKGSDRSTHRLQNRTKELRGDIGEIKYIEVHAGGSVPPEAV
jgi:hypothetical protein